MRERMNGLLVAGAVSLALVACGGGAPAATPSPTPEPPPTANATPEPTASPVDVAAAFVAALTDPSLALELDVSGTMRLGAAEIPISGTMKSRGADSETAMEILVPGAPQRQGKIVVGGDVFEQTGDGPWIVSESASTGGSSLTSFLTTLMSVKDVGTETIGGETFRHLEPPASASLDPAALGLGGEGFTDVTTEVDFYAKDDGTPALMTVAAGWTQQVGSSDAPVSIDMTFRFVRIGEGVSIRRPDDPWLMFTSERFGYRMAHPEGWTVVEADEEDQYMVDGIQFVGVIPQPISRGMDSDEMRDEIIKTYTSDLGAKPEADEPIKIGGLDGHLLTYHFDQEGQEVYFLDAIVARGGTGWEIFLFELAGTEAEDRPFFEQFIKTFAFTE
jgi:hypothetical protein